MTQSRFELLVGLHVTDQDVYATYRKMMMPILEKYKGSFTYDFAVDQNFTSGAEHPINRLFVITFPDEQGRSQFFNDPDYKQVREKWFNPAVAGATIISSWITT
ncbi:MAG TPA: DUF1330 domain-containing protein [Phycisphaerales bacterium]|nr:DUF1330 domain-containing protein [Phycisphaerales bacterium]|tara:strand:+ start:1140 stop:1451 length:312 start_codon:yes stop_codon:yes gene_type:complete